MPLKLPPVPYGSPPGSSFWNDWYEKLRTLINNGSVAVLWSNINFAGSSLADLATKAHNSLQSIQGGTTGEFYHLTSAQYAALTAGSHNSLAGLQGGTASERYHLSLAEQGRLLSATQYDRTTTVINKAGLPVAADIAAGQWAVYKDTTGGTVRLWANDGGTLKSVTLI